MADLRDDFQKLLESTYIPSIGNGAKAEEKLKDFLNYAFQIIPEKLYRYRQYDENAFLTNMILVYLLIKIKYSKN